MDKYRIIQTIAVIAAVAALGAVLWAGVRSGQARAQSKLIVGNAQAIAQGVNYFYSDYDRYPTVLEFETSQLMGNYLKPWPDIQFSSSRCSESLGYQNLNFKQYILTVCLPAGYGGLPKGLSEFTVAK